jgi:xanthine dehydrogenase accessory factor
MIGSKRKVELTKKMFIEGQLATTKTLEKIDMPMGLNIGAESPEEIAISILAKLIEIKNSLPIPSKGGAYAEDKKNKLL